MLHVASRATLHAARFGRRSAEEVFGPIMPLIPFETEADVIRKANTTEYGLAGYAQPPPPRLPAPAPALPRFCGAQPPALDVRSAL